MKKIVLGILATIAIINVGAAQVPAVTEPMRMSSDSTYTVAPNAPYIDGEICSFVNPATQENLTEPCWLIETRQGVIAAFRSGNSIRFGVQNLRAFVSIRNFEMQGTPAIKTRLIDGRFVVTSSGSGAVFEMLPNLIRFRTQRR